jgi:DNA-3-methyladenine glycosylase
MFGPPGVAYVYLVYGMYHCLNVVTEPEGRAAAILIRAAEPLAGLEAMRAARAGHRGPARPMPDARLASGPGVLCAAFSITRADTGLDLLDDAGSLRLELAAATLPADRIAETARVGIDYAAVEWRDRPWRFVDRASPSVSGRPA